MAMISPEVGDAVSAQAATTMVAPGAAALAHSASTAASKPSAFGPGAEQLFGPARRPRMRGGNVPVV